MSTLAVVLSTLAGVIIAFLGICAWCAVPSRRTLRREFRPPPLADLSRPMAGDPAPRPQPEPAPGQWLIVPPCGCVYVVTQDDRQVCPGHAETAAVRTDLRTWAAENGWTP